ncbi:hypothetical protein ACFWWT_49440, partial [Streptomyces sp. NPDC058676]
MSDTSTGMLVKLACLASSVALVAAATGCSTHQTKPDSKKPPSPAPAGKSPLLPSVWIGSVDFAAKGNAPCGDGCKEEWDNSVKYSFLNSPANDGDPDNYKNNNYQDVLAEGALDETTVTKGNCSAGSITTRSHGAGNFMANTAPDPLDRIKLSAYTEPPSYDGLFKRTSEGCETRSDTISVDVRSWAWDAITADVAKKEAVGSTAGHPPLIGAKHGTLSWNLRLMPGQCRKGIVDAGHLGYAAKTMGQSQTAESVYVDYHKQIKMSLIRDKGSPYAGYTAGLNPVIIKINLAQNDSVFHLALNIAHEYGHAKDHIDREFGADAAAKAMSLADFATYLL